LEEAPVADLVALLVNEGLLNETSAHRVRELLQEGKGPEDAILQADGVSEESLLKFLAKTFELPTVDLEKQTINPQLISAFPARLLIQNRLMPVSEVDGTISVATSRVFDHAGLDELRLASGKELKPVLAPTAEIERAMKRFLGVGADTLQSLMKDQEDVQVIDDDNGEDLDLTKAAQDASIIKFVNQILTEAIETRATDVHFEPFEDQLRVRYRIDGELVAANIPSQVKRLQPAIVSRLKILSHLDIAEKRLPQDGRIKLKIAGREIDVRVSIIPMLHGEATVLRILDRGDSVLSTDVVGMAERDRRAFDKVLEMPHGIVLVTGPTGSGKTTTLYAGLTKINSIDRKIITIEDPVEYQLKGVNQIQVNTKAGLTFGSGLRAILRHDPDVVLIGEIRDKETAEIAVQASLTGHLVFSTLHTNDAPSAATRMIDMGVEPYLIASSLEVVLAQRLVRVICPKCKEPVARSEVDRLRGEFGAVVPDELFRGTGCRNCVGTGYRGRTGIFELMIVSDEVRELILNRSPSGKIRKVATAEGMSSLRQDGWRLIREGRTTVDEVIRATKEEHVGSATVQ
jgi:general secretion pathway protein E/type IV pilus assembly protein PilB